MENGEGDFMDRFTDDVFDQNDVFDGKPDLGDYLFEPDNPYMTHQDPFKEGIRLMEVGGSLSEAALCFEAICQLQPKDVDGWTYLGTVQAQNEKELAAIRALEQAIRLDEANLPALMVFLFYIICLILEFGGIIYKRRIRYSSLPHTRTMAINKVPHSIHCPITASLLQLLPFRNPSQSNRPIHPSSTTLTQRSRHGR